VPGETRKVDTDYWTLLCFASERFDFQDGELYSPSLKCQSIYYIAAAMRRIATHWDSILKAVESIMDDGNTFMYPEKLQATFVENESFSQSRKFYWAIKAIHEFIKYLNDEIQQWKLYREARVAPFIVPKAEHFIISKNMGKPWYSVKRADEAASTACEELEGLRRRFERKLEEVKVMRDGVSLPPYPGARPGVLFSTALQR
jgi:hypothetical protein